MDKMKKAIKGRVNKDHQTGQRDSSLRQAYLENINQSNAIRVGYIKSVQSEPLNVNTRVSIGAYFTNMEFTNVPFPGMSVSTDQSGKLGVNVVGLHGFYEGAVEGKMVAYGFIDGNNQNPIVLNSYPYIAKTQPGTDENYISPLSKKNFDSQDVFMAHFTGSYIVLNSKLPVPGTIQVFSKGRLLVESEIDISIKSRTNIDIESNAEVNIKGASINLETIDGHKLSLSPLGLKLEDPLGNEFEFSLGEAKFNMTGITTKIGAYGLISDTDIVGGDLAIPISLLTHKHLGNLGFPTGSSIP
jgi:hypothetical protein